MVSRLRSATVAAAALAVAVTVLGSLLPEVGFGLRSISGHVAIETGTGMIAVLMAYLVLGRIRRRARVSDVLLFVAFTASASTALAFGAIPTITGAQMSRFPTWAGAAGSLLSAASFAAAPFTAERRVRVSTAVVFAATLALLAAIGAVAGVLAPHLPFAISAAVSPDAPNHPRIVGSVSLLAVWSLTATLGVVATFGFISRARADNDELYGWFALFAALHTLAAFNYFLFPSRYSQWLFLGDYLRLAAFVVLLTAAAREIAAYQRGIAAAAVLEERRRLARELHDGLAQELAFISTQTRRLIGRGSSTKGLEQLALAAERALDESRSAIRALTRQLDEPLEIAVAQAAEEVADRVGITLRLELQAGIAVPATTREALLRIVREAVNNTARHGEASEVTVTLSNGAGMRLRIADDGIGFDPSGPSNGFGFGLASMRERAEALGGQLLIESRPGAGTRIEVVFP